MQVELTEEEIAYIVTAICHNLNTGFDMDYSDWPKLTALKSKFWALEQQFREKR